MTGDSGRRIAGSPVHVKLVDELAGRERTTEVELTAWSDALDALTPPPKSSADDTSEIMITVEHAQRRIQGDGMTSHHAVEEMSEPGKNLLLAGDGQRQAIKVDFDIGW